MDQSQTRESSHDKRFSKEWELICSISNTILWFSSDVYLLVSHLLMYCSESDITGSYNFTEAIVALFVEF